LSTPGALMLGIVPCWIYGFLAEDAPLLFSSMISFVLVGTILVMTLRYG